MNEDNASRSEASPVDDVRLVRERLSERFENDVRKLAEHAREVGRQAGVKLGCRIVRREPSGVPSTEE